MNRNYRLSNLESIMRNRPQAWASLQGSSLYPNLSGTVRFYEHPYGILVVTEAQGLPDTQNACASPIFGLHIHEGESCTGNAEDTFADARMHYNPRRCPHPYHSGDLPPLFSANRYAVSACLTDRFNIDEIIGKTVILHSMPDDFTTQPSGNSGSKIACGEIKSRYRR